MPLQLVKAQRSAAYLKLGISAPSGGGKTLGALLVAYGLLKEKYPQTPDADIWAMIAIIDTENNSGQLYVGSEVAGIKIGAYNTIPLSAPFTAERYTEALTLCEQFNMKVAIIDSSTHLWSGEGGLLEAQNIVAKRTGNSYTAWRDITPQHNRFVEAMLQSPMHIIATMRAKQEYVQEKDSNTGKTSVKKLGMEPEQRKGMEYEFTIFLEIDSAHEAFGAKDRTSLFDQRSFKITPEVGRKIMRWLESGVSDTAPVVLGESVSATDEVDALKKLKETTIALCKELGGQANIEMMELVRQYEPKGNPNAIKEASKLKELHDKLKDMLTIKETQTETKESDNE